jgi:hypothetical protein
VTTSVFGRDSRYDFIVTEILRCHFEVDHVVRTRIDIIESAREDGNTRLRRTLPHIVVTFGQLNFEFARQANSKARLSPDFCSWHSTGSPASRIGGCSHAGRHTDIFHQPYPPYRLGPHSLKVRQIWVGQ